MCAAEKLNAMFWIINRLTLYVCKYPLFAVCNTIINSKSERIAKLVKKWFQVGFGTPEILLEIFFGDLLAKHVQCVHYFIHFYWSFIYVIWHAPAEKRKSIICSERTKRAFVALPRAV